MPRRRCYLGRTWERECAIWIRRVALSELFRRRRSVCSRPRLKFSLKLLNLLWSPSPTPISSLGGPSPSTLSGKILLIQLRNMSGSAALESASKLGDLLAQLPLNQPNQWSDIELTAQSLANDLRSKNGSLHPVCSLACSMPTHATQLNNRLHSDKPCCLRLSLRC